MAEKLDRRIRKTRALLRSGLAELMQEKNVSEITVKELVERVDINRSTFYLHYADIETMLHTIEDELMQSIEQCMDAHPIDPHKAQIFPMVEDLFALLDENRKLSAALLGPHGDIGFLHRIEKVLSDHSLKVLIDAYPERAADLQAGYAFCLSGCVGLIKSWLTVPDHATPKEMAAKTYRLIHNAMQGIAWDGPAAPLPEGE